MNTVIAALMPPAQKENVKNVAFSAQGTELRMDADVRFSAVPGMEMMAALGFAKMTGVGPVGLVQPGVVGWRIRTIEVSGVPLAESIWGPAGAEGHQAKRQRGSGTGGSMGQGSAGSTDGIAALLGPESRVRRKRGGLSLWTLVCTAEICTM